MTVRISKRPRSIPSESIQSAESGRVEKFPDGPMMLPIPGPTLAIAVAAPLMAVSKSRPMAVKSIVMMALDNTYKLENPRIVATIRRSTGFLWYVITKLPLG